MKVKESFVTLIFWRRKSKMDKKVWIRGAGDLATGIGAKFFRAGCDNV